MEIVVFFVFLVTFSAFKFGMRSLYLQSWFHRFFFCYTFPLLLFVFCVCFCTSVRVYVLMLIFLFKYCLCAWGWVSVFFFCFFIFDMEYYKFVVFCCLQFSSSFFSLILLLRFKDTLYAVNVENVSIQSHNIAAATVGKGTRRRQPAMQTRNNGQGGKDDGFWCVFSCWWCWCGGDGGA